MIQDRKPPILRCVQIKGAQDDPLLTRLEKFAQKIGTQTATAARLLLKTALDLEESRGKK